ncbi:hypothetical protein [Streptomyces sp. NPDC087297]|uniref:hypothetical protein n=1 Tax=Streptomyces sp. NPDC087297 TaxID=3365778 RepID=UPI003821DFD3
MDAGARIGPAISAYVHGAVAEAISRAAADAGAQGVLPPRPVPCGLHDVDSALGEAWDTAAGVRTRRRPLPKQMTEPPRRRGRCGALLRTDPEPPPLEARLQQVWALARTAAGQVADGTLRRSLHPPTLQRPGPA